MTSRSIRFPFSFNPVRHRLAVAMALSAILLSTLPTAAPAAPRFQPHEQMIMADTLVPGGRLSVSQFSSSMPAEDLLRQLEDEWSTPELPPMRSQRDSWQVITHLDGEVIETIEVRRHGPGIQGRRIRLTPDPAATSSLEADKKWFGELLPKTATPMPAITHVDGGHRVSTFVASTDDSVVRLDNWIGRRLLRDGYQIIGGVEEAEKKVDRAIFYARGGEEVALTVTRHENRQYAVVHWRRP